MALFDISQFYCLSLILTSQCTLNTHMHAYPCTYIFVVSCYIQPVACLFIPVYNRLFSLTLSHLVVIPSVLVNGYSILFSIYQMYQIWEYIIKLSTARFMPEIVPGEHTENDRHLRNSAFVQWYQKQGLERGAFCNNKGQ